MNGCATRVVDDPTVNCDGLSRVLDLKDTTDPAMKFDPVIATVTAPLFPIPVGSIAVITGVEGRLSMLEGCW
jgi:hypothetical protein